MGAGAGVGTGAAGAAGAGGGDDVGAESADIGDVDEWFEPLIDIPDVGTLRPDIISTTRSRSTRSTRSHTRSRTHSHTAPPAMG